MYCCITASRVVGVQGMVGVFTQLGFCPPASAPAVTRRCMNSVWWYALARPTNWSPSQKSNTPCCGSSPDQVIWLVEVMMLNWLASVDSSTGLVDQVCHPGRPEPMENPGCPTAAAPRRVPGPLVVVGRAVVVPGQLSMVGALSGYGVAEPVQLQVSPRRVAAAPPNMTASPFGPVAIAWPLRTAGCPVVVCCTQSAPSHVQVSPKLVVSRPPNRTGAPAAGL